MAKKGDKAVDEGIKIVASNRKARHEYEILETVEAGLSLVGSEVKSLRAGKASLREAFGLPKGKEIFLMQMHIPPYEKTGYAGHEPERPRKLLMHEREIRKFTARSEMDGLTLVPLRLYFRGKYAKIELAVCRGKKSHDKRAAIKERETNREMGRELKRRGRTS
ncbi:MAG: SsrA-binding protein SmpB [candidate division Zixibacteria bacterium]